MLMRTGKLEKFIILKIEFFIDIYSFERSDRLIKIDLSFNVQFLICVISQMDMITEPCHL